MKLLDSFLKNGFKKFSECLFISVQSEKESTKIIKDHFLKGKKKNQIEYSLKFYVYHYYIKMYQINKNNSALIYVKEIPH